MASSSEWIAAMAGDVPAPEPQPMDWMAQLAQSRGFVEGLPFGGKPAVADVPEEMPLMLDEREPEPESDPVADAFVRGEIAGREAAALVHEKQTERLRALRLSFRSFDQAAMDSLASELADTVLALCAQAIAGFATDPEALLGRCAEASRRLGMGPSECKLHLHPDDISLIEPAMLEAWQVVPDAGVEQGGLRLEGVDGSVSDGPPDWRRAIAAAIRG